MARYREPKKRGFPRRIETVLSQEAPLEVDARHYETTREDWERIRRRGHITRQLKEVRMDWVYCSTVDARPTRFKVLGTAFLDSVAKIGGWPRVESEWRTLLQDGARVGGWFSEAVDRARLHTVWPLRKAALEQVSLLGYSSEDHLPLWPDGHHLEVRALVRLRDYSWKRLTRNADTSPAPLGVMLLRALRGVLFDSPNQVRSLSVDVEPARGRLHNDAWTVLVRERSVREPQPWVDE